MELEEEVWPGNNILHPKKCLINLNKLRRDNQLCDVILQASGESIVAHKNVLSACSPYFLAMFTGQFPESNRKEIELQFIDVEALKILIDYMYTSYIKITSENVQSVLEVACFLQINWVRDICCQLLENELDLSNCIGMKRLADRLSCGELSAKTKRYVIKNFHLVCTMDEFMSIDIDELQELLSNDNIYFHTDNVIFNAVMHWVNHHPDQRVPYLSEILMKINPKLVDKNSLSKYEILERDPAGAVWYEKAKSEIEMEWNIFILDKMGKVSDLNKYGMKTKKQIQLASLPSKAFAVSLVAYKNLLCVQGGEIERKALTHSFLYDVYRNSWTKFTPLIYSRSHHRSCIVDNTIYILGGQNSACILNSGERIDILTGKRSLLSPMLEDRSSFGAVVYENCIYVMGGENDHVLYTLERYDPRVGKWQSLCSMTQANGYCSSAIVSDYLYCSEGLGVLMERYDFRNNSWDLIDYVRQTETFEMFSFDNELYSISGNGVYHFKFEEMDWISLFSFPNNRDWDTAVPLEMVVL